MTANLYNIKSMTDVVQFNSAIILNTSQRPSYSLAVYFLKPIIGPCNYYFLIVLNSKVHVFKVRIWCIKILISAIMRLLFSLDNAIRLRSTPIKNADYTCCYRMPNFILCNYRCRCDTKLFITCSLFTSERACWESTSLKKM